MTDEQIKTLAKIAYEETMQTEHRLPSHLMIWQEAFKQGFEQGWNSKPNIY